MGVNHTSYNDRHMAIRAAQTSVSSLTPVSPLRMAPTVAGSLHETQVAGPAAVVCFHSSHLQRGGVFLICPSVVFQVQTKELGHWQLPKSQYKYNKVQQEDYW